MAEHAQPRPDNTRSLAWLMLAFVLGSVLLEADGLVTWAERLEVGPLRSYALPAVTALQHGVRPLGIPQLRGTALAALHRLQQDEAPQELVIVKHDPAPVPQCPGNAASPATVAAAPATAATAPNQAAARPPSPSPAATTPKLPPPVVPGIDAGTLDAIALPKATPLPALPPLPSDRPRNVVLVGDSMMAVGLSSTLLRSMAGHANLHPVRAFRSGTGLSRPDVFDWMSEYPTMLGQQHPDVIIVAIGANDGQGFVEDGKTLSFGSDAWIHAYETRLTEFLDMLTSDGTPVLWLGLPPMRLAKYNQHMMTINRIAYRVVSQHPHASWWSTVPYIADAAGQYREFAQSASGNVVRIRADDGIHLSDDGAALFTPTLLAWLEKSPPVPAATPAVVPAATPVATPASAPVHTPTATPTPAPVAAPTVAAPLAAPVPSAPAVTSTPPLSSS